MPSRPSSLPVKTGIVPAVTVVWVSGLDDLHPPVALDVEHPAVRRDVELHRVAGCCCPASPSRSRPVSDAPQSAASAPAAVRMPPSRWARNCASAKDSLVWPPPVYQDRPPSYVLHQAIGWSGPSRRHPARSVVSSRLASTCAVPRGLVRKLYHSSSAAPARRQPGRRRVRRVLDLHGGRLVGRVGGEVGADEIAVPGPVVLGVGRRVHAGVAAAGADVALERGLLRRRRARRRWWTATRRPRTARGWRR